MDLESIVRNRRSSRCLSGFTSRWCPTASLHVPSFHSHDILKEVKLSCRVKSWDICGQCWSCVECNPPWSICGSDTPVSCSQGLLLTGINVKSALIFTSDCSYMTIGAKWTVVYIKKAWDLHVFLSRTSERRWHIWWRPFAMFLKPTQVPSHQKLSLCTLCWFWVTLMAKNRVRAHGFGQTCDDSWTGYLVGITQRWMDRYNRCLWQFRAMAVYHVMLLIYHISHF